MDYKRMTAFLIGNATHDAEIKQAKESHKIYSDFRLAVRNRAGETSYFPIRCFGKLAESATAIKKGTKLFVEGELEITPYITEDGTKQMSFRVVSETYRILSHRKHSSEGEPVAKT